MVPLLGSFIKSDLPRVCWFRFAQSWRRYGRYLSLSKWWLSKKIGVTIRPSGSLIKFTNNDLWISSTVTKKFSTSTDKTDKRSFAIYHFFFLLSIMKLLTSIFLVWFTSVQLVDNSRLGLGLQESKKKIIKGVGCSQYISKVLSFPSPTHLQKLF